MSLLSLALFAQLAAPVATMPVLSFPERGLDDSAAYQGYQTRFYRDAAGNTVQVYLDSRADRVVHLWADADDESFGFTARAVGGRAAALQWNGAGATVWRAGRTRTLEHALVASQGGFPGRDDQASWDVPCGTGGTGGLFGTRNSAKPRASPRKRWGWPAPRAGSSTRRLTPFGSSE